MAITRHLNVDERLFFSRTWCMSTCACLHAMLVAGILWAGSLPQYVVLCCAETYFLKKIVAYDVETLNIAKGMASYPLWLHKDVISPTWQYGYVSVVDFNKQDIKATIKGFLINSHEQTSMAVLNSPCPIQDKEYHGHPLFQ